MALNGACAYGGTPHSFLLKGSSYQVLRRICEDGNGVFDDLHEAAGDDHGVLCAAGVGDLKVPLFEACDEGGVVCKDTEITQIAGGDYRGYLAVIDLFFRRYNDEFEILCHLFSLYPGLQLLSLLRDLLDRPHHIECLLREVIHLSLDDHLKAPDCVL